MFSPNFVEVCVYLFLTRCVREQAASAVRSNTFQAHRGYQRLLTYIVTVESQMLWLVLTTSYSFCRQEVLSRSGGRREGAWGGLYM